MLSCVSRAQGLFGFSGASRWCGFLSSLSAGSLWALCGLFAGSLSLSFSLSLSLSLSLSREQ